MDTLNPGNIGGVAIIGRTSSGAVENIGFVPQEDESMWRIVKRRVGGLGYGPKESMGW
jgi:hypothetical protein